MRTSSIALKFVESFPDVLEPGVLYVSAPFSTAAHLCACGCGHEVVTPLSPARWVLTFDGKVSVRPSIGNWALPCQSHYVIDQGTIRWARSSSEGEIRQKDDRSLLDKARTCVGAAIAMALRRHVRLPGRRSHR